MDTQVAAAPHPTVEVETRTRWRYRALEWVRSRTERKGGRYCMHSQSAGDVRLGATADGAVHVEGVKRCASPWSCPVCAPTIAERRAREVEALVNWWRSIGGAVVFLTATFSHRRGQRLGKLLDLLQQAWSRTWSFGRRPDWYGGMVRTVEMTYGENGWHPHVHTAVFIEPGHGDGIEEVRAMGRRWKGQVEARGGSVTITAVRGADGRRSTPGWDVRPVTDADGLGWYLSKVEGGKWGVGLELARSDLKASKGRSVWSIRAGAVDGDVNDGELWAEYEKATTGRRRIVCSPGLMERSGVREATDDEAAAMEAEGAFVVRAAIPSATWNRLLAGGWVGKLRDDLAALAKGEGDGWPWPPEWLLPVEVGP